MRRALLGVTVALAVAGCGDSGPPGERFFAAMTGQNVVPAVNATNAGGTANLTASAGSIAYNVQVQNIVGVTRVVIFRGDAGVNGTVAAELYSGAPSGAIASATIASGTLVAANVQGISVDSLVTLMRGGHAYIQVHTQSQPNGEIRGQIHAS